MEKRPNFKTKSGEIIPGHMIKKILPGGVVQFVPIVTESPKEKRQKRILKVLGNRRLRKQIQEMLQNLINAVESGKLSLSVQMQLLKLLQQLKR